MAFTDGADNGVDISVLLVGKRGLRLSQANSSFLAIKSAKNPNNA